MNGSDVLTVIAEISLGFMGFAGIVGVLGRGGIGAGSPSVALRFWAIIEFGLGTLLLALLPFVLHHLGATERWTWGGTSTATALFVLFHAATVSRLIFRAQVLGQWMTASRATQILIPLLLLVCLLTQLLNAAGLVLDQSFGGVLLGLFLLIGVSGLNFFDLLVVLRSETE